MFDFIVVLISIAVPTVALVFLNKGKNNTISITQQQADKYLARTGGGILWLQFRFFMGVLGSLSIFSQAISNVDSLSYSGAVAFLTIFQIALLILSLVYSLKKRIIFIYFYIVLIYIELINGLFYAESHQFLAFVIAEGLFLLYLLRSKYVAYIYKTKHVIISDPTPPTTDNKHIPTKNHRSTLSAPVHPHSDTTHKQHPPTRPQQQQPMPPQKRPLYRTHPAMIGSFIVAIIFIVFLGFTTYYNYDASEYHRVLFEDTQAAYEDTQAVYEKATFIISNLEAEIEDKQIDLKDMQKDLKESDDLYYHNLDYILYLEVRLSQELDIETEQLYKDFLHFVVENPDIFYDDDDSEPEYEPSEDGEIPILPNNGTVL